ncbi:hypothetical protein [Candidatus Electronema sp. PJ]|uniref:hypothetical protein n=1 Tax=Candidatus Electronema sp. PJ TaxID=3401572 RepID=UPI003AA87446
MDKKLPDITISFYDNISSEVFDGFVRAIKAEGLDLRVKEKKPAIFFSAEEWLVPTAVVVYIAKSYFDGFLGEMGKEHYGVLRKGIAALWAKFFGSDRVVPQGRLMAAGGEIRRTEYTHTFSILVQSNDGRLIKLILKEEISKHEYQDATDAFLTFIERHHAGVEGTEIPEQFCSEGIDHQLFVSYDAVRKEIQFRDILPEHIRRELMHNKSIHLAT